MQSLRFRCAACSAVLLFTAACRPPEKVSDLDEEFVYTALSFSPSLATAAGMREYKGRRLDTELDDMGPAAFDRQTKFYVAFEQRLKRIESTALNAQDAADVATMEDRVGLGLFDLVDLRGYLHDPLRYVLTLGNALYTPYVLEYAPKPERYSDIAARLRKTPLLLDQATANMSTVPGIWAVAAINANKGVIDLVDGEMRAAAPPESQKEYNAAAAIALAAMRKFQDYLTNNLQYLDNFDWRLGNANYSKKFHFVLESGGAPEDLLASAEHELVTAKKHIYELALPAHRALFPTHKDHAELPEEADRQRRIVKEVLDSVAAHHSTPESLLADAARDLEEAQVFVRQKNLLPSFGGGDMHLLPTPEYRRVVDTVSAFQASPALHPQMSAFYWVTPIPADMAKEDAEGLLREYNPYRMKLRLAATAIPGSYSATAAANTVQPPARRLLRTVFAAHAYTQGWSEYAAQFIVSEGFPDHSAAMELTLAKERLRMVTDAILDVRLHILNMSDQEALDLLEKDAYQEPAEAARKLRLAKLTSCQLAGYFVGAVNWAKAQSEYRGGKGVPAEFRERALRQGGAPMTSLLHLIAP